MIDTTEIRNVGRRAQQRVREGLAAWRKKLADEGRSFPNLDEAGYTQYCVESFLRGLSRSPLGKSWVLKGGRVAVIRENSPVPNRPTLDVDIQRLTDGADLDMHRLSPDESLRAFKADVAAVVTSEEFVRETGLVFDLEAMQWSAVREGVLADAWRLEGEVGLGGAPGTPGAPRIRFILEVTAGPAPTACYERVDHPAFLTAGPAFQVLVARPEWMVAEKLHAVATRPANNTRYKDWWDIVQMARVGGTDPARMAACMRHVFADEFGLPVPTAAAQIEGLTTARATADHEKHWQGSFFSKIVGRDFDPARDPSFLALASATAAALERVGAVEPSPAGSAARALADLLDVAEGKMADAADAAAFQAAFDALVANAARAERDDIAFRLLGELTLRNREPVGPAPLVARVFEAARAAGLCERLDDCRSLKAAFAGIADRLAEDLPAPAFVAGALPKPEAKPAAAVAVKERALPSAEELAKTLARIAPGGKDSRNPTLWMVALATAWRARQAGVAVDPVEVAPCPLPEARVAQVWANVSGAQGVAGLTLEDALAAVAPAPAPGM